MSFIPEVTSSVRTLKADSSANDKQQQRKYFPEAELVTPQKADIDNAELITETSTKNNVLANRRKGEERRQSLTQRGRWLDLRERKDRREAPMLYLSI